MAYQPGDFCWVDLIAREMTSAAAFYRGLFGWTANAEPTEGPPYQTFACAGKSVGGMGQMSEEFRDSKVLPVWNSYVSVANVDLAVAQAEALGARVLMAPVEVMTAGRMAIIQDPVGAAISFWQPVAHDGSGQRGGPGFFCWNELLTCKPEKARDFYAALFGWKWADSPHSQDQLYYVIENEGRQQGGIMQADEAWGEVPSMWQVYFGVSDVAAAVKRVVQLEGKIHFGPFETAVGKIAWVADSQGATFALVDQ